MLITNKKYSDIPFFISKNAFTDDLNVIADLSTIRQSLKNIILTNNGERRFDFYFGGNIYNYLFENFSIDLKFEIQANLANVISLYEPRVLINKLIITENAKENALNININYGIIGTRVVDDLIISLIRTR